MKWLLQLLLAVILLATACSPISSGGLSQCGYCPYGPVPRDARVQAINGR
jgi:hypothetical protein